jgi:hypothetical protein
VAKNRKFGYGKNILMISKCAGTALQSVATVAPTRISIKMTG